MDTSEPTTADPAAPSMFSGIWTIPNAFTLARLLCLPIFLWLLFDQENRAGAAWMLGALGATDWIDGYLARRLGQVSEFGKVFDPTVDRLLFIVALTAIIIDGSIPLWFALAILVREIGVGVMMVIATVVFDMPRIDVTFAGKTATFLLMFAVPGFLMGNSDIAGADWFTVAAWILGIPGLALSYWTAAAYVPKVRAAIRSGSA
ncbi:MAG: CDP-alcohol phosphatidyltransferase family protein [Actinomycetota bacterium]